MIATSKNRSNFDYTLCSFKGWLDTCGLTAVYKLKNEQCITSSIEKRKTKQEKPNL